MMSPFDLNRGIADPISAPAFRDMPDKGGSHMPVVMTQRAKQYEATDHGDSEDMDAKSLSVHLRAVENSRSCTSVVCGAAHSDLSQSQTKTAPSSTMIHV
jgi:hypothetical protein